MEEKNAVIAEGTVSIIAEAVADYRAGKYTVEETIQTIEDTVKVFRSNYIPEDEELPFN